MQAWSSIQHHRFLCVLFLAVIMVGTAGGTCWAVFFRTVASPVSLGQAMRLYRKDRGTSAVEPRAVMTPGVYNYATSGGEGLNLLGMSRSFPGDTDMVVTADPSGTCSIVRWVPIEEHTEDTTVCRSEDNSLAVTGLTTFESIAGTNTTTVVSCPATTYVVPPVAAPGVHWSSTCHQVSPSENVAATGVVIGAAPFNVGGQRIQTIHVRLTFDFQGTDNGTSPEDFWISTDHGMIVRQQEVAHITQGSVDYTEHMATRLTSLTSLTPVS